MVHVESARERASSARSNGQTMKVAARPVPLFGGAAKRPPTFYDPEFNARTDGSDCNVQASTPTWSLKERVKSQRYLRMPTLNKFSLQIESEVQRRRDMFRHEATLVARFRALHPNGALSDSELEGDPGPDSCEEDGGQSLRKKREITPPPKYDVERIATFLDNCTKLGQCDVEVTFEDFNDTDSGFNSLATVTTEATGKPGLESETSSLHRLSPVPPSVTSSDLSRDHGDHVSSLASSGFAPSHQRFSGFGSRSGFGGEKVNDVFSGFGRREPAFGDTISSRTATSGYSGGFGSFGTLSRGFGSSFFENQEAERTRPSVGGFGSFGRPFAGFNRNPDSGAGQGSNADNPSPIDEDSRILSWGQHVRNDFTYSREDELRQSQVEAQKKQREEAKRRKRESRSRAKATLIHSLRQDALAASRGGQPQDYSTMRSSRLGIPENRIKNTTADDHHRSLFLKFVGKCTVEISNLPRAVSEAQLTRWLVNDLGCGLQDALVYKPVDKDRLCSARLKLSHDEDCDIVLMSVASLNACRDFPDSMPGLADFVHNLTAHRVNSGANTSTT